MRYPYLAKACNKNPSFFAGGVLQLPIFSFSFYPEPDLPQAVQQRGLSPAYAGMTPHHHDQGSQYALVYF